MSAYCCLPLQREPSRKVCISPYYKMVFHEILFSTNEIFVGCKSNVLGVFLRVHFSKVFFPLPASHELFYSCACAYLNSNAPSYFFFISLQHYGHDALPWNNGRNGTTSTRITSGCSGEKSSRISETNAHNMRVRVTCICQLSSVVFRFRSTQLLFFKFCMFTSSLLRIRTPSSP